MKSNESCKTCVGVTKALNVLSSPDEAMSETGWEIILTPFYCAFLSPLKALKFVVSVPKARKFSIQTPQYKVP